MSEGINFDLGSISPLGFILAGLCIGMLLIAVVMISFDMKLQGECIGIAKQAVNMQRESMYKINTPFKYNYMPLNNTGGG